MDIDAKIELLNGKIDEIVARHQAVSDENKKLKRSLEEKEKETGELRKEVDKLKLEKKEAAQKVDGIIEKITKFFEEKRIEPLL